MSLLIKRLHKKAIDTYSVQMHGCVCSFFSAKKVFCTLLLFVLFFFLQIFPFPTTTVLGKAFFVKSIAFAASTSKLEQQLARETSRAQQRRANLNRLTEQEKKLNSSLAYTEKSILDVESTLKELQTRLRSLAKTDAEAEEEYETIKKQREETYKAQQGVILLLWEIVGRRESVGGREMADWAVVDREYRWSKSLLKELDSYHNTLAKQESDLGLVLAKRGEISKQINTNLKKVNSKKEKLLSLQISYSKQLANVRKELKTTEQELTSTLKIVESINLYLEKSGGDIARQKGKLPWPVSGKIAKKFSPNASPAFSGLGIAAKEGQAVLSVASGKVVHSGIMRGLGTVLILQHGKDYYTIYAYLSDSPLPVGREVQKQERIGTVGFFPDINTNGMYFGLRFGQKAINPEQWLEKK